MDINITKSAKLLENGMVEMCTVTKVCVPLELYNNDVELSNILAESGLSYFPNYVEVQGLDKNSVNKQIEYVEPIYEFTPEQKSIESFGYDSQSEFGKDLSAIVSMLMWEEYENGAVLLYSNNAEKILTLNNALDYMGLISYYDFDNYSLIKKKHLEELPKYKQEVNIEEDYENPFEPMDDIVAKPTFVEDLQKEEAEKHNK